MLTRCPVCSDPIPAGCSKCDSCRVRICEYREMHPDRRAALFASAMIRVRRIIAAEVGVDGMVDRLGRPADRVRNSYKP